MLPDLELLSTPRILTAFPCRDIGLRTRTEIGLLFPKRDKAVVFLSLSLCFIPTAIRPPLTAVIPDSLDLLPDRAPGNCPRYRCTFGRGHISLRNSMKEERLSNVAILNNWMISLTSLHANMKPAPIYSCMMYEVSCMEYHMI